MAAKIAVADVFVALFSPEYFDANGPIREENLFRRRAAAAEPDTRVIAILWRPLPSPLHARQRELVAEIGAGIAGYQPSGLSKMLRLRGYEADYRAIVSRVAARIVGLVRQQRLGNSIPGELVRAEVPPVETPFVIAVAAPTQRTCSPQRQPTPYGSHSTLWAPYSRAGAMSAVAFVENVARTRSMPPTPVDIEAADGKLLANPGILLIDPWLVDTATGEQALERVLSAGLSQFFRLITVMDEDDPQHARCEVLYARVQDRLELHRLIHGRESRHWEEFTQIVPELVEQIRRQMLRAVQQRDTGDPVMAQRRAHQRRAGRPRLSTSPAHPLEPEADR